MSAVRNVTELLSEEQIKARVMELAGEIATDYRSKQVLLVGVLKGSVMLIADLSRALWKTGLDDVEMDFMGISSYEDGTESSKNPKITKDLQIDVQGRHVLLVEDVVDTGYSLAALISLLQTRGAASVKTCVLLSKESRREIDVSVDYLGFNIEGWVEGYGMDSDELYRGRPNVVVVED